MAWCLVSRHRIRTCFSEFIITNRTGSLPLILAARPTPAGERLWVWLRPGLCLADVQDRTEEIAAACWATAVVADLASASNSALVRIDIKRRDPLTGTVTSPLAQLLGGITSRPQARHRAGDAGPRPARRPGRRGHRQARAQERPGSLAAAPAAEAPCMVPSSPMPRKDDITDWI